MRGVIRRALQIDAWYWIIILAVFVFVISVPFVFAQTNSTITRAELDNLEDTLNESEKEIIEKDSELDEQRKKINDYEETLQEKRDEIRELKRNTEKTWEEIKIIQDLESELIEFQKTMQEYRAELKSILTEKSDLIKLVKSLGFEIENSELERPADLSHLAKKIGITLSKSCVTMLQNNITSSCPTYKQLVQLDSSNTDFSGKFTTDDSGFFHRGKAPIDNSWRVYDDDPTIRIFVDPPQGMAERIRMIEIKPNFDTYTLPNDMTVHDEFEILMGNRTETLNNNTRTVSFEDRIQTQFFGTVLYHDRYIDDRCKQATINAEKARELLPDTIHLMRNDCDRSYTGFEEREVIITNSSEIDYSTSPNYDYFAWLEEVSNHCIFKYKQC